MTFNSNRLFPEVLRSFDTSTASGSYQAIGTPLVFPSKVLKFINLGNITITLSWDGVKDEDIYPLNSFFVIDENTNKSGNTLAARSGQQFWLKSTSGDPGTGLFYVVSFYSY